MFPLLGSTTVAKTTKTSAKVRMASIDIAPKTVSPTPTVCTETGSPVVSFCNTQAPATAPSNCAIQYMINLTIVIWPASASASDTAGLTCPPEMWDVAATRTASAIPWAMAMMRRPPAPRSPEPWIFSYDIDDPTPTNTKKKRAINSAKVPLRASGDEISSACPNAGLPMIKSITRPLLVLNQIPKGPDVSRTRRSQSFSATYVSFLRVVIQFSITHKT